jgi:hypothetical protein
LHSPEGDLTYTPVREVDKFASLAMGIVRNGLSDSPGRNQSTCTF